MKFYKCEHCGNIMTLIEDKGVPVVCCGEKMKGMIPGTTDAALEKHVPVVERDADKVKVKVGSVEHPMTEEHSIQWIVLEKKDGYCIKHLNPSVKPEAEFTIANGDEIVAVYEYCNLHGLWKA